MNSLFIAALPGCSLFRYCMRSIPGLVIPLLFAGCFQFEPGRKSASNYESRPNIIVILADDMGYSDLGSYGGEIDTPNLDRLAEGGLRFTQFYNTSRCVPTRASLLTGLYSHQAGLGAMTFDWGTPAYRGRLMDNAVTVAELLQQSGYQTGMVGKWHLSETHRRPREEQLEWLAHRADYGPFSPLDQYPTEKGFQDFYGTIWGVVDYFDPFTLVYGDEPVQEVPADFYYTDALSDSAAAFIRRYCLNENAPFFLYLAHTAPHWPLHAPAETIAKYEEIYDVGWDRIREARYERMVEKGLIYEGALSPRIEPGIDWSTHPDTMWDSRAMAVHAAMVDKLDEGIGRLLQVLEDTGELENTLILFLSDNGASSEYPSRYGPGFDRAGSTRDRREVYFPVDKTQLPGPQTVHAGIGPFGANTMNTPFRWWKARVHEGGIATPMIAHWPAGVQRPGGSLVTAPGHVIDIAPTLLDLAGVPYPAEFQGRDITPVEGKSLVPLFLRDEREGHDALYWEHGEAAAVRQGNWKLVRLNEEAAWELYDLSSDRTELNDLALTDPQKAQELATLWDAWASKVQVYPKRSE